MPASPPSARVSRAGVLLLVGVGCLLLASGWLFGLWSWGAAPWLPAVALGAGLLCVVAAALLRAQTDAPGPAPTLGPTLAVLGAVLWLYSFGSAFGFVARGPTSTERLLINAALLAGLACHLGALGTSLVRWRRGLARVPALACLYAAGLLGSGGLWLWSQGATNRFLQANPDAFTVRESADASAVEVRDARGVWRVPRDACPGGGSGGGFGTRQHEGVADVAFGSTHYYLRLHVATRRVECLPPGSASAL